MKPIRIFEFYGFPGQFKRSSRHYYHGMWITLVAAKSIKQAYYLANNNIWASLPSLTGIVELCNRPDSDLAWERCDGERTSLRTFKDGQAAKTKLKKLLEAS